MSFQIASDDASHQKRLISKNGFLPEDESVLEFMKLLERKNGVMQPSASFPTTKDERVDFLTWLGGDRSPPLPSIVRRILCNKRAVVSNSIQSIGGANSSRTGESRVLQEIDALLKQDGVTQPDSESCVTAPSKFKSVPPPAPVSGNKPATQQGCHTTLTCDTSALTALITDIKTMVDKLITLYENKERPETMDLAAIQQEMAQLRELLAKSAQDTPADRQPEVNKTASDLADVKKELQTILDEHRTQIDGIPGRVSVTTASLIADLRTHIQKIVKNLFIKLKAIQDLTQETKASVNTLHEEIAVMREEMRASMENIKTRINAAPFVTTEAFNAAVQQLRALIETTSASGRDAAATGIQNAITALGAQIAELRGENAAGQHAALIQQHEAMQGQLTAIAGQLTSIAQDTTTQTALEGLRAELADLRTARSPNGRVNALTTEQQTRNARIAELEAQIAELEGVRVDRDALQATIQRMEAERQQLNDMIEQLNAQLDKLEPELTSLRNSNARKAANLARLTTEHEALSALKDNIQRMLDDCTASKTALEQHQRELEGGLRSKQSSIDSLQRDLDKARADIKKRNEEYKTLVESHERNLASSIQEAMNETQGVCDEELEQMRELCSAELNSLRKENAALKEQIARANPANAEAKDRELAELRKRCEAVALQHDALKKSSAAAATELENTKAALATATAEVESLRRQLQAADAEHERALSNMAGIERNRSAKDVELEEVKRNRDAARSALEGLQGELDSTKATLEATGRNRDTARSELEATGRNRDAARSRLEELQGELGAVRSELAATGSNRDTQKQRADMLQAQLTSATPASANAPATMVSRNPLPIIGAPKVSSSPELSHMNYSSDELKRKYIEVVRSAAHRTTGNDDGKNIVGLLHDIYTGRVDYDKDILKTNLQKLKTFVPHVFEKLASTESITKTNYIAYLSDLFEKLMKYTKPRNMNTRRVRYGRGGANVNKFGNKTRKVRRT